jgi:hypothetical protein
MGRAGDAAAAGAPPPPVVELNDEDGDGRSGDKDALLAAALLNAAAG